jgi:hypothetical protein
MPPNLSEPSVPDFFPLHVNSVSRGLQGLSRLFSKYFHWQLAAAASGIT